MFTVYSEGRSDAESKVCSCRNDKIDRKCCRQGLLSRSAKVAKIIESKSQNNQIIIVESLEVGREFIWQVVLV